MGEIEPITWQGRIRFWDTSKASGLAVLDVPAEHIAAIGGLKQQRVRGTLDEAPFGSSVMPAGGGRLALSVSKAMMSAAHVAIGDEVDVTIEAIGKD